MGTTDTLVHLPTPHEVRGLLEGLLGRAVEVAPCAPLASSAHGAVSVASYVDDQGMPRGVCCVDVALGAAAGAALGLMPVRRAVAATGEGLLDPELEENLDEVLNVCATVLNAPGALHVRLALVHHPGRPVPAALHVRTLTLGRRLDLAVEVPGYGRGRLSFVLEVPR
jgi:hypothetical protein